MRSAEVVIVGGGVIGASAAWHLAARGCTDVVVCEREPTLGRGSTGRASGGFRTQFSSPVNIRLSLLSRQKLLRFGEEVGGEAGYRPCGYLFLAADAEQLALLREMRELQRSTGLAEVEEVTADDISRFNPAVKRDGLAGGSHCRLDGFVRPLGILDGYASAARRLGVRFECGAEVRSLVLEGPEGERRVTAVETSGGRIATRHLVNAAGAWAASLAHLAGVELPVRPLRRQVALSQPFAQLPEDMPMTIFTSDGFHLRVRDGRVLLLWPTDLPAADPFSTAFDTAWLPGVVARAHERVPCLAQAGIDAAGCWAGLYEMSPDNHVIAGRAPGVANFYLLNGSSGHGVMHSPALGQLAAEMVLDGGARSLDIHALRPSRFAEGQPNPGVHLL